MKSCTLVHGLATLDAGSRLPQNGLGRDRLNDAGLLGEAIGIRPEPGPLAVRSATTAAARGFLLDHADEALATSETTPEGSSAASPP